MKVYCKKVNILSNGSKIKQIFQISNVLHKSFSQKKILLTKIIVKKKDFQQKKKKYQTINLPFGLLGTSSNGLKINIV